MKKSHVILRPNEVLSYIRETAEILRTLGQEVDRRFLESSAEMDRRFGAGGVAGCPMSEL
ncbi:hypothetical protein CCP3SC1_660020 [Gammaproteobacteria bacterium]